MVPNDSRDSGPHRQRIRAYNLARSIAPPFNPVSVVPIREATWDTRASALVSLVSILSPKNNFYGRRQVEKPTYLSRVTWAPTHRVTRIIGIFSGYFLSFHCKRSTFATTLVRSFFWVILTPTPSRNQLRWESSFATAPRMGMSLDSE